MADKVAAAPPGKLVLKPGVICGYLENFSFTEDKECMQYSEVRCQH